MASSRFGVFAQVDPDRGVGCPRSGWVGGRTGLPGPGWSDAGLGWVGGRTPAGQTQNFFARCARGHILHLS